MSSGQSGVLSVSIAGGCGGMPVSSARDDSHCPHSLGACADCLIGGLSRLSAVGDDDPLDLVSSVVVVVILIGLLSDVSMSSGWSACANSPTCALNRWRRRENVLKNAIESSAIC